MSDKNVYNYENLGSIKDNNDIDIVYVVTPNAAPKDFVIRAAQAGQHVIYEKAMALSVEDCDAMIAACKKVGKLLSIGYRLKVPGELGKRDVKIIAAIYEALRTGKKISIK